MDLGEVQTRRAACGAKTGSSVCTSERLLPSFRTFLSSPTSLAIVLRGTASYSRRVGRTARSLVFRPGYQAQNSRELASSRKELPREKRFSSEGPSYERNWWNLNYDVEFLYYIRGIYKMVLIKFKNKTTILCRVCNKQMIYIQIVLNSF